jgi:hypothetical protein
MQGAWSGCFQGYWGEAMHYLGYELPRITIPGSWVNKGKKKGRNLQSSTFVWKGLRLLLVPLR